MNVQNNTIKKLLEKYREIALLNEITSTLHWDLNVNLPRKGSEQRSHQITYLTSLITDKWLDPEIKFLLDEVRGVEKLTQEEKAIVRNLNRAAKFYFHVPKKLILEQSEVTSRAFVIWSEAKVSNDFKSFEPILSKIVALTQSVADYLGYKENPYDALLDLYEPDLTATQCRTIFDTVQPSLTQLLQKVIKSKAYNKPNPLLDSQKEYALDLQKKLCDFISTKLHYPYDEGRLDISSHPFTTTLGRHDVRITTRYDRHDFKEALYSTIHEIGHALYELGVDKHYSGTPLEGGVSLGIHESQSRFWENQVGRSREFVSYIEPILGTLFQNEFQNVDQDMILRYVNDVRQSYIRTEADEVTYGLHIILRFQIENDLMNKKIQTKNLPEVWNTMMKKYVGVVPPTDREGVLQDVHWSMGSIGYFPTYLLGNLYAAQFTASMKKKVLFEKTIAKGDLLPILNWLRTNVHTHGSMLFPKDLVKQVTGEALNADYYLKYLQEKYSTIYNF